eukprot:358237-Chlamydomonas_euryale.AAC.1
MRASSGQGCGTGSRRGRPLQVPARPPQRLCGTTARPPSRPPGALAVAAAAAARPPPRKQGVEEKQREGSVYLGGRHFPGIGSGSSGVLNSG